MAATLHFDLTADALHQAFNSLDADLESRTFQEKGPDGKQVGVLIKTANSLWAQKDLTFEKVFLDTLAANYGAGIRLVDYKSAAEQARRAINDWVAEQTADKIPELIPQGALDSLTRLVLVNAIYLDATWMSQFEPTFTKDADFTTLAGKTVKVQMMHQTYSYPYGKGDGWQAVELPYLGGKVAMLVIVPDAGKFQEVEDRLAPASTGTSVSASGATRRRPDRPGRSLARPECPGCSRLARGRPWPAEIQVPHPGGPQGRTAGARHEECLRCRTQTSRE